MHILGTAGVVGLSVVLSGFADLLCQVIEHECRTYNAKHEMKVMECEAKADHVAPAAAEEPFEVDWPRTFRWMLIPGFVNSATSAIFFGSVVPFVIPGNSTWDFVHKYLIKVVIHGCGTFTAIVGNSLLAGLTFEELKVKVPRDWPPCWALDVLCWIPGDIIQFKLIPPDWQALWIQIYTGLLGVIGSYFTNRPVKLRPAAADAPAPPEAPGAANAGAVVEPSEAAAPSEPPQDVQPDGTVSASACKPDGSVPVPAPQS